MWSNRVWALCFLKATIMIASFQIVNINNADLDQTASGGVYTVC